MTSPAPFTGAGSLSTQVLEPGYALFNSQGTLTAALSETESITAAAAAVGALGVDVSAPYPEPGEFPDWEHVLVDLLTPITYTCTTLPPTVEEVQALLPLFLARRIGGGLDFNAITERPQVQIIAFSWTRTASYALARQAREAVLAVGGTEVGGVLVDFAEEITGNVEWPDIDPMNRTVAINFYLYGRRQHVFA